jgi:uncharacterized protein involved in type VI secretion and phage assembly
MKKELLKGVTMLMLIVVLAFATAIVSANAQSSNRVVAEIPFQFTVGDRAMPSGKYAVKATSTQGNALMIQSADAKRSAIRLTNSIESTRNKERARLVFHRYGERYFLAEVWTGASSTGQQLLKSRREAAIERELASNGSRSELARTKYEIVEVVATLH